jgi:hypothetical protein
MNLSNLLKKREARIIIVDLLMIFILIINLNLIVFDWIFSYLMVQNLLEKYLPSFFYFYYENVHKDFLRVDLYFVTVFVVELLIRWGIAIKLGCIPVGEFRFLRILRVISIMLRLQKLEIIDLTKTYLFDRIAKYMNILVEEVSDRVVVNVLENIQDEIHEGTPVSDRVITEVIMPQKTLLVEWLSQRLQTVSSDAHRTYKEDIQQYVEKRIADAVNNNKEIKDIGMIPVFGSMISRNLERAISDIVFSVVNGIIQDLASTHNREIVSDLTDLTLETILVQGNDEKANLMVKEMVLQSIEIVKDQVKVKKWKVKDEREKEERIKNRLKEAIE